MSDIKIGDFVKGTSDKYWITNTRMTRGVVIDKVDGQIRVKVIDHEDSKSGCFWVDLQYFEVIGHQKPFNRDEVLDLLLNGCKKAILEYDLSKADLRGADLSGADLSWANLRGADLRGANLRGANLSGADLRGANLNEANLNEANLRGANLSKADLRGADLNEANLNEANLNEANLRGANLRGANLNEANLRGANLRGADLRGADLDFSCLPLWCGGLRLKVDKRLACQLAYHLCSMQCDDAEFVAMRNSILSFANQFNRAGACGILTEDI